MNRLATVWLLLPALAACGEQYCNAVGKSTASEPRPHVADSAGSGSSATARSLEADVALEPY